MCHRDGVDVVVGCCSDNSNITLGDICSLCFVSCGLVLCFYTSNAIVEVTGITYYSNLVTNVLHRYLHFHTGSDIVAVVVVLNLTTIVYNCHLNTLYIRSHGGCRVCSALSLWSEVRTVLDEIPSGSHISGRSITTFVCIVILILSHTDRNKVLSLVDNLYISLGDISGSSSILCRCLCSIYASNRICKIRRGVSYDGHLVLLTLNRYFEYDTVTSLDTVSIISNGLAICLNS